MINTIHIKSKETPSSQKPSILCQPSTNISKKILTVINHPKESASESQKDFKNLKNRRLNKVGLFVSDDLTELDTSISKEFP